MFYAVCVDGRSAAAAPFSRLIVQFLSFYIFVSLKNLHVGKFCKFNLWTFDVLLGHI